MSCGSGGSAGPGVYVTLAGSCALIGGGRAGGGVYLKVLRLLTMWFPTSVLRPKARQSTTVMLRGGWRCSFSGNSYRTIKQSKIFRLQCKPGRFFHIKLGKRKLKTISLWTWFLAWGLLLYWNSFQYDLLLIWFTINAVLLLPALWHRPVWWSLGWTCTSEWQRNVMFYLHILWRPKERERQGLLFHFMEVSPYVVFISSFYKVFQWSRTFVMSVKMANKY